MKAQGRLVLPNFLKKNFKKIIKNHCNCTKKL